jgi:putative hydrolase of the HAD superfamily
MERKGEVNTDKHHYKIQAVVFDLFHTLVDPEDYRPRDFVRTKKIADLFNLDPGEFAKYWSETSPERCTKRRKTVEYVADYVAKIKGKPASRPELAVAELTLGRYQDLAIRNPSTSIRQTVAHLKYDFIELGLLSNADEREVSAWPVSPLASEIDAVCFSFDIGYMKPAKEAYAIVLNRLGVTAQSAAYVGEGPEELQGARDTGFGFVVFTREHVGNNGVRTPEEIKRASEIANVTIDRLSELPPLIEKAPISFSSVT